ncbi:MAG: 30S ribosomal protein S6 [Deltaproteobacteria bacterium]|nr:30S ribosomal protein S6 [Deltaproteobacteria bacterium]
MWYELLYIVSPVLSDEAVKEVQDSIDAIITQNGGELLKSDVWGRRKLAYPIKKYEQGVYVLVHFKSSSPLLRIINEKLKFMESVIRFMVSRMLKKDIKKYKDEAK